MLVPIEVWSEQCWSRGGATEAELAVAPPVPRAMSDRLGIPPIDLAPASAPEFELPATPAPTSPGSIGPWQVRATDLPNAVRLEIASMRGGREDRSVYSLDELTLVLGRERAEDTIKEYGRM